MKQPNTQDNSRWVSVISSRISGMEYNERRASLDVRFRNGRIYRYSNVAASTYNELVSADSIGGAFEELIVRGNFEYRELQDAEYFN